MALEKMTRERRGSGSRALKQRESFLQPVVALVETGYTQMEQTGFLRPALSLQLVGHFVDLRRVLPVVVEHVSQQDDGPLGGGSVPVWVVMFSVFAEMLVGMSVFVRVDVGMSVGMCCPVRVRVGMGMFVDMFMAVAAGALVLVFFVH